MIEVKDRIPTYPNRIKLVPVEGEENTYDIQRADQPTEVGTPVNQALFDSIRNNLESAVYHHTDRQNIGDQWDQGALPSGGQWLSPVYGDGKYVTAKCNSNQAAYSTDGIIWHAATLPVTALWRSAAYGNGRFVLVADATSSSTANVVVSTSGTSWSSSMSVLLNPASSWHKIVFGNGVFVMVGSGASPSQNCRYSYNGLAWHSTTGLVPGNWWDVEYAAGTFVAVSRYSGMTSETACLAHSKDGKTWTTQTDLGKKQWTQISYYRGMWIAFSEIDRVSAHASSPSYYYWHTQSFPGTEYYNKFAYGNDVAIAVPSQVSDHIAITTPQMIYNTSWNTKQLPVSAQWSDISFGNGMFTLISSDGSKVLMSTDGDEWTVRSTSSAVTSPSITYCNDRLMVLPASTSDTGGATLCSYINHAFHDYDGIEIPILFSQMKDLPSITKYVSGSYTGTGVAGSEFQNMLCFDFTPRFGIIMNGTAANRISFAVFHDTNAISFFTAKDLDPTTETQTPNIARLLVTKYGNTISWRTTIAATTQNALAAQCNVSNETYHYIFWG